MGKKKCNNNREKLKGKTRNLAEVTNDGANNVWEKKDHKFLVCFIFCGENSIKKNHIQRKRNEKPKRLQKKKNTITTRAPKHKPRKTVDRKVVGKAYTNKDTGEQREKKRK